MTTTFNAETGRAATTHDNGTQIRVFFGWVDKTGENFRPAHSKPSRTYKTAKTAERAASRWINA